MTNPNSPTPRLLKAGPRPLSIAALLCVAVLALAAAGCGSTSSSGGAASGQGAVATSSTTHFAKTKFVLHAGLAFGAFHHFIYKPAKAGDFAHPFSHKFTLIKAALAGAFVVHELKLALSDAQADPTLSKLVAPITALQSRIAALRGGVQSGNVSPSTLAQDNGQVGSIESQSSASGQPIQEQVPATP